MGQNIFNTIWSIAIYKGETPFTLAPMCSDNIPQIQAKDVTDISAQFVADPFMLYHKQEWNMFFEVMNESNGLGEIAHATSKNLMDWKYQGVVLREEVHLSYPFVFAFENRFYMVPESRHFQEIRLYAASSIDGPWTQEEVLIKGDYADPTLFFYNDHWWMFVLEGKDNLQLFFSDTLSGPWHQHPNSPIIENSKRNARPAGKIIHFKGKLYRVAQDGLPLYGSRVRVFQILTLTREQYEEIEIDESPILKGTLTGWNAIGMHHIDAHQLADGAWVACVDGARPEFVLKSRSNLETTVNG